MVQAKESKLHMDDNKNKTTTLIISQDFKKQKAEPKQGAEMVMKKSKDVPIVSDESKKTTLTIA